jgi:hypothetical protein
MPEYRRRRAGGVWHWYRECPTYPDHDFLVRDEGPPDNEADLCPTCLAIEATKRGIDAEPKQALG